MEVNQALQIAKTRIVNEFSGQLKTLLESKHLYQKISVDVVTLIRETENLLPPSRRGVFESHMNNFVRERFFPSEGMYFTIDRVTGSDVAASLVVQNAKLYCTGCKSAEVFKPVYMVDAANEVGKRGLSDEITRIPGKDNFQLIFVAMQCQRCKRDPEGFLIRRSGYSLYLEGRSPIEHIDLPAYIPKKEKRLFSDALVAHNAGKTLAGLFYLRAFIEQFARRQTGITRRATGDEILESYSKLLPEDLRGRFPSLRDCYDRLSVPIHLAQDDDHVFDSVIAESPATLRYATSFFYP